jgi:hypothetical protein
VTIKEEKEEEEKKKKRKEKAKGIIIMRFSILAFAGLAAASPSLYMGKVNYPEGISPPNQAEVGPFVAPPTGALDIFHPAHVGIEIDDCDNLATSEWHWVQPATPPKKKEKSPFKWTTSTITATKTKTVTDCGPEAPCHGGIKTKYTTVTVTTTTTICPVPITPSPPKVTNPPPGPPAPPITPTLTVPPKPVTTPSPIISTISKPSSTTNRVFVTGAAVPNVQRAGGALVAVAVAAALI